MEHVSARRRSEIIKFLLVNLHGRTNLGELVVDDNNEGMCLETLGKRAQAGMKDTVARCCEHGMISIRCSKCLMS